jgi:hypothetical protein
MKKFVLGKVYLWKVEKASEDYSISTSPVLVMEARRAYAAVDRKIHTSIREKEEGRRSRLGSVSMVNS